MSLITCNNASFSRGSVALLLVSLLSTTAFGAVGYEFRAKTGDNVRAIVYAAKTDRYNYGIVRQGSFGAPAINDKNVVAYPCIMSGAGLTAFTNIGVVTKQAKRGAVLTLQAGFVVNDNFMPKPGNGEINEADSAYFWHIGQNVGINNAGRVNFDGQLLYTVDLVDNDGKVTGTTDRETGVYGTVVPKGRAYINFGLAKYETYDPEILNRPVSINTFGSTAYNAEIQVTDSKYVEGFLYSSISTGRQTIATVESNVIGLSYFTTFVNFSTAIVADGNVAFVVAGLSDDGADFDGIWQGSNPNIQPVVVKTTAAPGGGQFTSFDPIPGPSRNGTYCAFVANVTGGKVARGVFRANKNGDHLIPITSIGKPAPNSNGSGTSAKFSDFTSVVSSNLGQVAIVATVAAPTGAGGTTLKTGLWLTDKTGKNLTQIVLTGQSIDSGAGIKTINKITVNPICCINRSGTVTFTASFSDRTSAVIVASQF